MSNSTIAAIFMGISVNLLVLAVLYGMPLMTFWGIIATGLSVRIYNDQKKGKR